MKKIYSSLLLGALLTFSATAQQNTLISQDGGQISKKIESSNNNSSAKSAAVSVTDTLFYFFNKHFYRNLPTAQSFSTLKSPYQVSGTIINEFGSSFLNGPSATTGASVTISGGYILASRNSVSTATAVPVRVYLYNATPLGLPTNKIDSVMTVVTSTGGNFVNFTFPQPKTVTGSFFISYRPMGGCW